MTTFCDRIIVGLRCFTKREKNTRARLTAARMFALLQKDPIVIPASRKTAYSTAQLEEMAESRWVPVARLGPRAESSPQGV